MSVSLREQFFSQGYCCLEDVIPESEIAAVCASVERDVYANTLLALPSGYVPGFLRFNQALAPYVASPRVVGFVESLLGPHLRISMFTGTVNGPGIPRGDLHADWPYNQAGAARIPAPYPDCLMHVVTMWMLSDFTPEGGGTIVVPGSHRHPDHPRKDGPIQPVAPYPGERQLVGRAGTVAVFDARLWHAVAPNRTGHPRVAAIVRYAPWWLNVNPLRPGTVDRQEIVEAQNGKDSQVPSLPRGVFEKLPPELQKLVRYSVAE
ncbi:MAG TPA: phytanoyl-CoA dioxygenase family protein [Bryobacteraceae bacterium]|nr:phytanoyl-CoA dioxygenase family protein [Bryobacteraceae bacterium]